MTESFFEQAQLARLRAFSGLQVAFSGGLDSTVLLHALTHHPLYRLRLQAVHINHQLSPHSEKWQQHCEALCQQWGVPFRAQCVSVPIAGNVEENARNARYQLLQDGLPQGHALLTGHHQDDQVETVLLQLARGTGIDGLCGMREERVFGQGVLLRPLLSYSRKQLSDYAKAQGLSWVDDDSNDRCEFSRNFLRHQIVDRLQTRWPGFMHTVVRTTRHCREAQSNLQDLALLDCPGLLPLSAQLPIEDLENLSEARLNNVLRTWLRLHTLRLPSTDRMRHLIQDVVNASPDATPLFCGRGYSIRRYKKNLYLLPECLPALPHSTEWVNFPDPLFLEGWGILDVSDCTPALSLKSSGRIEVRARQGGEHLRWNGQTKSLKKCLQQWHIPPWQREHIPLIYVDGVLTAVGFKVLLSNPITRATS